MAFKETAAFFLLVVMVIPAYSANSTNSQCYIENATVSNNSGSSINCILNVNRTTGSANQTYTVSVTGSGNVTILLQALMNQSNVGNWSSGNDSCNGSPLFIDPFHIENSSVLAYWSSVVPVSQVVIRARILNGTDVYQLEQTLDLSASTAAPSNQTTTNAPKTTSLLQNVTVSATTIHQTTSTGSTKYCSSMFLALIQSIGLLFLTSKILS